ncbi:hypothetical protein CH252_19045 [Rhodococcus sp. 06-1477-1B]|nr:hypothetical protein CH252_19045 [Rhodococcus sp. 06-1477-1B]
MSRLEPADTIEATVGAPRHATLHIARADSSEQRVYLLHPEACVAAHQADGADLRDCLFSLALDEGIDMGPWEDFQDVPAVVEIDEEHGDLVPTHVAEARIFTRADLDHFIELGSRGPGTHATATALIFELSTVDATAPHATHWTSDAPTSLHGNGAASFEHTTRDPAHVTCRLCLTLLSREPALAANPTPREENA